MSKPSIARPVVRVMTENVTTEEYSLSMQTTATVLVDSPESTAYVIDDRLVLMFSDEYDITPILDQASLLGFTQLVRQWEDFTLGRTGMEFAREA